MVRHKSTPTRSLSAADLPGRRDKDWMPSLSFWALECVKPTASSGHADSSSSGGQHKSHHNLINNSNKNGKNQHSNNNSNSYNNRHVHPSHSDLNFKEDEAEQDSFEGAAEAIRKFAFGGRCSKRRPAPEEGESEPGEEIEGDRASEDEASASAVAGTISLRQAQLKQHHPDKQQQRDELLPQAVPSAAAGEGSSLACPESMKHPLANCSGAPAMSDIQGTYALIKHLLFFSR